MNTRQAEYKTDIAHLAEQLARREADRDAEAAKRDAAATKREADRDAEAAKRDAEIARRETRILLAIFAIVAVATTILGFLIRLPNPTS